MSDLVKKFKEDIVQLAEYKKMVADGPLSAALQVAQKQNTVDRFNSTSLVGSDRMLEDSQKFANMTGWNECIKFLIQLSNDIVPLGQASFPDAMDDDYVNRETQKRK